MRSSTQTHPAYLLCMLRKALMLTTALMVSACSGGSGGDPVSLVMPVSLSGELIVSEALEQDADRQIAGQFVIAAANNEFSSAQRLNNPSSVGGYVSASSGSYDNGVGYSSDPRDIYSIPLLKGQTLSFTIQDAETTPVRNMNVGVRVFDQDDLDMPLYSVTIQKPLRLEYEVPQDGEYFLVIDTPIPLTAPVIYQIETSRTLASGMRLASGTYAELASSAIILRNKQGKLSSKSAGGDEDLGKLQALREAAELQTSSSAFSAEPDYQVKASSLGVNDPLAELQWNLSQIGVDKAWAASTGVGVRIAVIDTGFSPDHTDLQSNVRFDLGYDFIRDSSNGDGNGLDADVSEPEGGSFHGSHIAGLIAAGTNNNEGVAGIAYGAEVIPVRVLDKDGGGSAYDIAQGIRYAAGLQTYAGVSLDQPVDIINLSLGLYQDSFVIADAVRDAVAVGVIVIAAAGNERTDAPYYPAFYPEVVGVGSVNHTGFRSLFSNFGGNVDVMAPGGTSDESIYYDGIDDGIIGATSTGAGGTNNYGYFIGTSFAAPHVAGVAALMKSLEPNLDASLFSDLLNRGLLTEARSSGQFYGRGVIDAGKAIAAVGGILDDALLSFPNSLAFSEADDRVIITLSNPGSGSVLVDSIEFNVPWLSVSGTDTDGMGLGRYAISIDRVLAGQETETAQIEVTYSINGGSEQILVVPVLKSVDTALSALKDVYVYLVRREDVSAFSPSVSVYRSQKFAQVNGRVSFRFDDLAPGNYYLEASTDLDGDQRLFDPGEAIGAYRLSNSASFLSLTDDRENVRFEIRYQTLSETGQFAQSYEPQIDRLLD